MDDLALYVQLSRDLGASLNFSLLTCEPDDEVLGGLLPGADELRMLGRALLTLDNGKPLPAMRICGGGCRARSLFESGNLESKDSYCLMTQAFYDVLGKAMSESLQQRR